MTTSAHVGGAVPLVSPAYIRRSFEDDIRREVLAGRWVLLLGPRQHGKTSALLRLKHDLGESGLPCCYVDLQAAPPVADYSSYLAWFSSRVARDLAASAAPSNRDGRLDDLSSLLAGAVGDDMSPVVCIIDEASAVPESWRNMFYGQLRAIANERAVAKPPQIAARLRCVFAGTFRPDTLVEDLNSPFNVCQRFETGDLSLEQAKSLWDVVIGGDHANIEAAYADVGGQPYLLQRVLNDVSGSDESAPAAVSAALQRLRDGGDDHFEGVFGRIFSDDALASPVATMVREGSVAMSPADGNSKYLQTIGVARREDTRLVFRNPIYRDFAASSPQLTTFIPELPPGSVAVAIRLIPTPADAFDSLRSAELREFAETSVHAATLAYNAGAYRPALIGFGAALEALLIDVLTSRASPAEIAQAIAAAKPSWNQFEDRANPMSWRLVNLIRIARELPTNGVLVIDPPDALREWRNLVHPAAAINPYRASADLEPEARAASGLLAGLLRDLH